MIKSFVIFNDNTHMEVACEENLMLKQLNIFRESLVKKLKKHKKDTETQFLLLMVDMAIGSLEVT